MNKIFYNPEIRKSSLIIVLLCFVFTISSIIIINRSYVQVKTDYINSNAALLGKVSKTHPELKDDLVSIITKGSNEDDIKRGTKILKSYEYDTSLSIKLIPDLYKNYSFITSVFVVFIISFFIIIFMLNFIQYESIYKKLDKLLTASKSILDSNFDIGIYENGEGAFAKLAHEFNSMRSVIKNNLFQIEKEKSFLVNILSDISHQLKTPISSLIIYNDILLNRKVSEEKRVTFLEESGKQLSRIEWLVKSLLQLAKLDAGVIKFTQEKQDINLTAKEAVEALKVKAEERRVKLTFLPQNHSIVMKHDENWLSEAVINIVKNAVEHTSSGGEVKVITEQTQVCNRIIIRDNGEGIPKEEIPNIFKRFYKGKHNKNTESVGIGLALAKSIVEGHGGIIEVRSTAGEGTEFTITFLIQN